MANERPDSLLRQLRTLFATGTAAGLTDRQLLDRFTARRAESTESALAAEAAFAALVDRHGSMVWGVCRRVLGNVHEAEDAFQATFLVLVRKARNVQVEDSLGRWLYGVAQRVAMRARTDGKRRESGPHPAPVGSLRDPAVDVEWKESVGVLVEEIDRLPARYRCAVDLCCLQGMTLDQASRELSWPVATVKSRLARGRVRLRERLGRRGLAPAAAGAFAALSETTRAAVPPELLRSTVRAAASRSAAQLPATVTILIEGVVNMMMRDRLKRLAAGLVLGAGLTAGALAQQAAKDDRPEAEQARTQQRPTRSPSGAERGEGRWARTLSNGATVEVVGISAHPSGADTWWNPDGTKREQAPGDRSRTALSSDEDVIPRAIVVRIGHIPDGADVQWWIDGARGGSQGAVERGGKAVPGLSQAVTFLDRGSKRCTVRFQVAAGPWKTIQKWGKGPGARGSRGGPDFIFSDPVVTAKGTVLSVAHSIPDQEVRLVATDRDGVEHPGKTRSGSGVANFRQILGEFDLTPDAIEEFRVQTRAYETVEIPGVAVDPANQGAAGR